MASVLKRNCMMCMAENATPNDTQQWRAGLMDIAILDISIVSGSSSW